MKTESIKKRCIIIAFLVPFFTMLIAYIVNEVFPFGDRGVLIIDSLHQYLPFFTDYHEKLVHGQSMMYSFGGGLGYNMLAMIAYYLASPLNLLMALVPMSHVMDFMAYLILIKISLTGGIFAWYLTEHNDNRNYFPIPFACMYALSSFMIGYYFNIMWLDSIMVAPLVMWGIEKIVAGKSGRMFGLSLFYGLFCNYYIGYMLCLFSCLYFLAQWMAARKFDFRKFIQTGLKFTWFALLAGGMAAVLLIPAYLNLGLTESAGGSFPSKIKFFTNELIQLTGHFALVEPINIYDTQAGVNIYCGVIVLILTILYLLNKYIRLSERASRLFMIIIFLLSMNFNMLNYIWHGFHTQNGLPNRFAFLYICLLLTMGFDALKDIRRMESWRLLISLAFPVAFVTYCMFAEIGERPWYCYSVTMMLLFLYGGLLAWYRISDGRKWIAGNALCIFMTLEMAATGIYGVCMNGTVSRSSYLDEQKAYQTMISRAEDADGFYRSEIDSQRMRNENMFMGAKGFVLFSSTMPEATVNLAKSLGIEARTNKTGYNGMTKLFNDVFGIRYLVSKNTGDTLYQMEKVDYEEPLSLYENKDALSLGFMVSSNIKDWDISEGNPMAVQETFAALATGEVMMYVLREAYSLEEGPTYIIRLHPGEQTYLEVTENIKSLVIKTPQGQKTVNNFTDNFYNLGSVSEESENSKVNIEVTYKDGHTSPVPVKVYTCTDEEYQAVYDKLARNQLENIVETGNKVTGTIHVEEEGTLLLTIPYDIGWHILVDGEQVPTYRIGEALIGIDLGTGDHEIVMEFTPEGYRLGSIISLVCLVLFLLSCLMENFLKKRKKEKERDGDVYIFG